MSKRSGWRQREKERERDSDRKIYLVEKNCTFKYSSSRPDTLEY